MVSRRILFFSKNLVVAPPTTRHSGSTNYSRKNNLAQNNLAQRLFGWSHSPRPTVPRFHCLSNYARQSRLHSSVLYLSRRRVHKHCPGRHSRVFITIFGSPQSESSLVWSQSSVSCLLEEDVLTRRLMTPTDNDSKISQFFGSTL